MQVQILYYMVGSWPYPQTLEKAEIACQGQTLQLYMEIRKLRMKKSIVTFGPGAKNFICL
jgi:hypothetical protein